PLPRHPYHRRERAVTILLSSPTGLVLSLPDGQVVGEEVTVPVSAEPVWLALEVTLVDTNARVIERPPGLPVDYLSSDSSVAALVSEDGQHRLRVNAQRPVTAALTVSVGGRTHVCKTFRVRVVPEEKSAPGSAATHPTVAASNATTTSPQLHPAVMRWIRGLVLGSIIALLALFAIPPLAVRPRRLAQPKSAAAAGRPHDDWRRANEASDLRARRAGNFFQFTNQ
ncbi:putative transmembrane protein, partial [Gregarina niphandrodes]